MSKNLTFFGLHTKHDKIHSIHRRQEIILTPAAPSSYYYYWGQSATPLLRRDNKSEILGHLSE